MPLFTNNADISVPNSGDKTAEQVINGMASMFSEYDDSRIGQSLLGPRLRNHLVEDGDRRTPHRQQFPSHQQVGKNDRGAKTFFDYTREQNDAGSMLNSLLPIEQQPSSVQHNAFPLRKPAKRLTSEYGGSNFDYQEHVQVSDQPSCPSFHTRPENSAQMLPLLSPGFNIQLVKGSNDLHNEIVVQLCVNSPHKDAHDEIVRAIESRGLIVCKGSTCMVGRNMCADETILEISSCCQ